MIYNCKYLVKQSVFAVLTSRFAAIVSSTAATAAAIGPDPIVGVARCGCCSG